MDKIPDHPDVAERDNEKTSFSRDGRKIVPEILERL